MSSYIEYLKALPIGIREKLEKEIANKSEKEKEKIIIETYYNWISKCFEPNEAIGILTTQSVSEPATQATMRVYHLAGGTTFKITLGLPRLIELFDARKKISTPMMYIYLKDEYDNEENAYKIASEIVERKIWEEFQVALNLSEMTIEISGEEEKVKELYNLLKKKFKVFEVKKQKNKVILIPKKEYNVKQLRILKDRIEKLTFKGISGVERATIIKEGNKNVIQTLGSNLKELFKRNYEIIDYTKTYCNNPHEIAEVLGIEAARHLLLLEIYKTLQQQGLDVDTRFLSIIADAMCFTGEIQAIGRHGVAGRRESVLAKAGFEETVKHLVNAAIKNQIDKLQGPFENLMIGNLVPIGTGRVKLVYHERNK